MGKKRFIMDYDSYIIDSVNQEIIGYSDSDQIVDLLNEQDREIEILKKRNNNLSRQTDILILEKIAQNTIINNIIHEKRDLLRLKKKGL